MYNLQDDEPPPYIDHTYIIYLLIFKSLISNFITFK